MLDGVLWHAQMTPWEISPIRAGSHAVMKVNIVCLALLAVLVIGIGIFAVVCSYPRQLRPPQQAQTVRLLQPEPS